MSPAHLHQERVQTAKVAGVVSFYMCAALVMVFVNKAVLNSSPDLPLLFLLIQLLIAVALLHLTAFFSPQIKADIPHLDVATAKKLVPVVSVNIIGLVFNTLCLRDVEASFFQIARGMQIPLTIAVSSFATRSTPTVRVITAAAIVTVGFLLGVSPAQLSSLTLTPSIPGADGTPSSTGNNQHAPGLLSLLYGLLSALFIAIHSVLIKSSLPHCSGSTIQLAYWTNLGSALMIAPFVLLSGEPFRLVALVGDSEWRGGVFVWGSLVTGVFGFLLCVAGLLSIKVTSPVTHMFSGAARSVIQTLLGVWIFGDLLNVNRATSITVILMGTMFYTWAKHIEGQQAQQNKQRPEPTLLRSPSTSSSSSTLLGSEDDDDEVIEFDQDLKKGGRDAYALRERGDVEWTAGVGKNVNVSLEERERRTRLATVKEVPREQEEGEGEGEMEVVFDAEKADERV